jgi:hypothetical protein
VRLADIKALAATLPARHIIGEDKTPYLSRYKLHGWMPQDQVETPCSVYLHNIHRADLDEALHSHPWLWSQTTILHGGYIEQRGSVQDGKLWLADARGYRIGEGHVMDQHAVHRIMSVAPDTWTLFMVGPKRQSWGFFVEGRGMVPWRERLAERGLVPDYAPTEREALVAESRGGEALAGGGAKT